jgi:hypothetical protein
MEDDFRFIHELTSKDINFLKRLPSVKSRKINLDILCKNSTPVILKNQNNHFLLMTCYSCCSDFVYMHTTVGRDKYKDILFNYLLDVTTKIGPSYCVLFGSPASIKIVQRYGGKEIDIPTDRFVEEVNVLMNESFYIHNDFLANYKDEVPTKNFLYLVTRESYLNSLKKVTVRPVLATA